MLGVRNHRDAIAKLDDDEKQGVGFSDTLGGQQLTTFITEPGLYALVFTSNKPAAKAFSRWVRHEVLPALRKTGTYSGRLRSRSFTSPC